MDILENEKSVLNEYIVNFHQKYRKRAADIAQFAINYFDSLKQKYDSDPEVYKLVNTSEIKDNYMRVVFSLFTDFDRRYVGHIYSLTSAVNSQRNIKQLSRFRYINVFRQGKDLVAHDKEFDEYVQKFKDGIFKYIVIAEKEMIRKVFLNKRGSSKRPKKYVNTLKFDKLVSRQDFVEIEKDTITDYFKKYIDIYRRSINMEINKLKKMIEDFSLDPLMRQLVEELEEEYASYVMANNEYIEFMAGVYTAWLNSSDNLKDAIKNRRLVFSEKNTKKSYEVYNKVRGDISDTIEKYSKKYKFLANRNKLFDVDTWNRMLGSECDIKDMIKNINGILIDDEGEGDSEGDSDSDGEGDSDGESDSESESESEDDLQIII